MSEDEGGEKEHEPTQKKLDDARAKGEVPRSADLNTAAGYAGLLLMMLTIGGVLLGQVAQTGAVLLDQADRLAPLMLTTSSPIGGLIGQIGLATAPLFLLPMVAVILSLATQRVVIFAPDKLMPKLSRISPLATAKNKFGRAGLFEFAKSFAKLSVYSVILAMFLVSRMPRILSSILLTPSMASVVLLSLVVEFLFLVLIIAATIGGLDYLWQRAEHLRRNRMSRQELMDELKGAEGDPHMKQQRRQRGYEIATNRMISDVPKADVVIVNPTHYAVALKWNRSQDQAPVCLAKGVDEVAARIREAANLAGVPIHSDPPAARAIHATVDIGQEIQPDHYRAVAAAIRFAEKMKARAGQRRPK